MSAQLIPAFVKVNNFGDKLNVSLIEKIFGARLVPQVHARVNEPSSAVKVLAIGSYLSQELLAGTGQQNRIAVFGLGSGYAQFPIIRTWGVEDKFPARVGTALELPTRRSVPPRGTHYSIYWVRGPLSAQLMGLPPQMAIGDAGYMIRRCDLFERYHVASGDQPAFMPNMTAACGAVGLREVCEGLGIRYIDPRDPEDVVLSAIAGSSVLITEALHGAVVADALRTPWIAVKSSEDIFEFKWRDFCASIGVAYDPAPIRLRWDVRYFTGYTPINLAHYFANRIRSFASQINTDSADTAYDLLLALGRPQVLSSQHKIAQIDESIARALDRFFVDYDAGKVFVP